MKKTILSVILICTLCSFFAACGESDIYSDPDSKGEIVTSGETKAPDDEHTKKLKKALYEAYKSSVGTYESDNSYATRYSLADIDENGTCELIYNTAQGKYDMYTFDGKELIHSGGFNSKSGVFVYDGMLFATTSGSEYFMYVKISLDDNYKIYDIGYPYITREGTKYTFNKETITEDEYNTICDKMTELETYPISDLSHLETLLK